MTNLAFYLKYRPQTLDDLIGQEPVKRILFSAHQANKLSHAYLLVGPRGSGKTSTARILAKMVNCELVRDSFRVSSNNDERTNQLTTKIPCNKCPTCISITDGSNLDLIEIDAASNRGIEDIRSLREKIKLAPTSSKKKVYIIDEVHMLTTEAFNALLKTLEEPPNHALFILATTDAGKIPPTILSRVQRLDFKLASSKEILQVLEKIVKEEKVDTEEEALKVLAKKAEGSFRDGVKLLDQIASSGKKITTKSLAEDLSSSKFDDLVTLVQKLSEKQIAESLIFIQKQIEKGLDVKDYMQSLMDIFRSIMLIKNGVGEALVEPNFTEENYQRLVELSGGFINEDLVKILEILQNSFEKLRFASIQALPLELAVVEICQLSVLSGQLSVTSQSVVSKSVNELETEQQTTDKLESEKRNYSVERKQRTDNREAVMETVDSPKVETTEISADVSADILKLKERWTYVLETIRPFNFSLEALLRSISIKECNEENVIMEVPYSFHQRILEAPKNRDLLESILSEVLGRQIKVLTILGNRPQRREDIANIEVAADDEIIRVAAEIFNSDSVN